MKKFLYVTVVVIMAVVFLAEGAGCICKGHNEDHSKWHQGVSCPVILEKVSWKCSNKNIRITKKQRKKATIKGMKKETVH